MPRDNGGHLIDGLVEEFGTVIVIIHGTRKITCVDACWNGDPDRAWDCVCGCAGTNHGTRMPLGREVRPGLAVEHEHTRAEYRVDTDGWTLLTQ